MTKEVTCPPCGTVLSGEGDDELVTIVQDHAKREHGSEPDRAHILESAREV
jgi:predicted small metal-binding protein